MRTVLVAALLTLPFCNVGHAAEGAPGARQAAAACLDLRAAWRHTAAPSGHDAACCAGPGNCAQYISTTTLLRRTLPGHT